MSLLTRLFLLVIVTAIPALGAQLYAVYQLAQDRERAAHATVSNWANSAASEIRLMLDGAHGILHSVAASPTIRGEDVQKCESFLAAVSDAYPFSERLGVIGADGKVICSAISDHPEINVADRAYFREAMASDDFVVGPSVTHRVTGAPVLPLALRFHDNEGKPGGIVIAPLRLDRLIEHFREKPLPPGATFSLLRRDGLVILRLPETALSGTRVPPAREWLLEVTEPGTRESSRGENDGEVERIFGYAPLSRTMGDLIVAVGLVREVAFAGTSAVAIGGIVVTAAALVLALIAAFFGARVYVERPISRLSAAARRWASGDLQARAEERDGSSILDELAKTFNTMAAGLERHEQEQQQLIDKLRTVAGELNHRTKNSLAAVQAMMRHTAHSAKTLDEFLPAFERRLMAYLKTHELLHESHWKTASVGALAEAVVAPYAGDGSGRFEMAGDDARIAPPIALALALAFGELATNAAKYGAFSTETGRVRLDRFVRRAASNDDPAAQRLVLTWTEIGGPSVMSPTRSGSGSRLLQQIARSLGGDVELRFNRLGVVCEISFPHAA